MKVDVEPFPLVPAIWTGFSWSKSDGLGKLSAYVQRRGGTDNAHLIAYPVHPFYHLWNRTLVPTRAGLSNGFDGGEVALKGIESRHRGVVVATAIVGGVLSNASDNLSSVRSAGHE